MKDEVHGSADGLFSYLNSPFNFVSLLFLYMKMPLPVVVLAALGLQLSRSPVTLEIFSKHPLGDAWEDSPVVG